MHHALTTIHSSFISWSAVMYSNTIATVTAEQRWLSSTAVYIVKVIGSTSSAKVGIVVGNSTWVNKICIADPYSQLHLGQYSIHLMDQKLYINYTYTCCLMQSRWQCEYGEAQCRKWVTKLRNLFTMTLGCPLSFKLMNMFMRRVSMCRQRTLIFSWDVIDIL